LSSFAPSNATLAAAYDVAAQVREGFRGEILIRDSPGFQSASRIWNAMVARNPGVILKCSSTADVQMAVAAASQTNAATAIRCGGHSLAGFSTCQDGVVVDLSPMRQVSIDLEHRTARVAGGCLLGDIDRATQDAGMVFPAGVVSHTGASGLILGGGTGWLTRRYGLSCDNVLGFKVVLADGYLTSASERENSELYWALRGGGGNFGVVTEFELKLHPLKAVLLANAWCAQDKAASVLNYWRDFMPNAPDELKWNISLGIAPDLAELPADIRGRAALNETIIWAGEARAGQRYVDGVLAQGNPAILMRREIPYLDLQTMADGDFPHGARYYTKAGYFRELTDASVAIMLQSLSSVPSPKTQIELAYLGASCGRVAADETAFGDRSAPFVLNLLGHWNDPSGDAENVGWVRSLFGELRPSMVPGVYVNFMSADEDERVREAYHYRWERLLRIKQTYDPQNFFCRNQNVSNHRNKASAI